MMPKVPAPKNKMMTPMMRPTSPTRLVRKALRAALLLACSSHQWPMSTNEDRFPPPWGPMTERQAFFPVEPIDEVLTHGPAFAVQEHANLPVGVPDAGRANSVIRWRSSVQGLR